MMDRPTPPTPKRLSPDDLARITTAQAAAASGNGQQGPAREGLAEELAKFVEQHAADLVKEAEEHLHSAKEFANEIRRRSDEKIAELRAFTQRIKDSNTGMAEVRAKFLEAGTTGRLSEDPRLRAHLPPPNDSFDNR
jgi:hypothetical protein